MTSTDLDVLLVGIDAACLPVLRRLRRDGAIPVLWDLLDGGATGPLESQLPPWTPSAWPSLYTGTNPGRHGVFSFLEYDGYDWDVVDATSVAEPMLWEILDENGLSSVVVNAPVTHPPQDIDGAVLPGFVGPENPACTPPGLLSELRDGDGDYRVYGDHEFDSDVPLDARLPEYRSLVQMRGRAFRRLVDRFDPSFGFVQFQQTDTVVHDFEGEYEAIRAVYEAVDEQLEEILAATDPTYVLVASDHGIGEYDKYEFRVNDFLREAGYVETTRDSDGMPSWVPIWQDSLGGDGGDDDDVQSPTVAVAEGILDSLSAVGLSPVRVANALDRVGHLDTVKRFVPESLVQTSNLAERVDFESSAAYARLPVELGVRMNVAGREPSGVVAPEEYESVRAELIELLSSVRTPDGDPVFDTVLPREDVFEGPEVESAVDVVTVPAGFEQFPAARLRGDVFGTPSEPWNHKLHGVVSVSGPDVPAGSELTGAHLLDVAPTVLSLLDVPLSDRMEGTPLVGDVPSTRTYARPEREQTDTTDAGVESRLSNLGYLD